MVLLKELAGTLLVFAHLVGPAPIMDAYNTPLSFWPCDDVAVNALESSEYRNLPRTRFRNVSDFVTGDEFRANLSKAAIYALPRWRYAVEHKKKPITDDTGKDSNKDTSGSESDGNFDSVSAPNNLRGVARAQR